MVIKYLWMSQIEDSSLRALFWKDEILQILYWMDGEGLGTSVSVKQLLPLLNTNKDNLVYHLQKLVHDGLLESQTAKVDRNSTVTLSANAKREAGRRFADAFQGYQKAGHGECGPDCEFCYGPDGIKLENCVHHCGHQ